jgi:hypothetical protein
MGQEPHSVVLDRLPDPSVTLRWLADGHTLTTRSYSFNHSREFRRREPAGLDPLEIVVGRPPGDGASLSDVDRHLVLAEFAEEVARGRDAHAFDTLGGLP